MNPNIQNDGSKSAASIASDIAESGYYSIMADERTLMRATLKCLKFAYVGWTRR